MAKLNFRQWLNQFIGGAIKGGATSAGGILGVATGSMIENSVKPMDWQQIKYAFIGGAITVTFLFLQKNPIPNYDGNTDSITKDNIEP